MTGYVDGFVLPVKKSKLKEYRRLCGIMGKLMKKYGALEYMECTGDDLKSKWGTLEFTKMARAHAGETVMFSFITYKSRAHRDAVNKNMMKDPVMNDPKHKNDVMPFDMKRMAAGGFKVLFEMQKR